MFGEFRDNVRLIRLLIVSGLTLIVFYRCRVVKHPDELVVRGNDLEMGGSYLLSGITWFMFSGLLSGDRWRILS